MGGHVGVAGADVLVAGGAGGHAAAALAARVARPQAHLRPPRLAAPVRAPGRAICVHKRYVNYREIDRINKDQSDRSRSVISSS